MSGAPPLLAVPNISEGRNRTIIGKIAADGLLIDLHADPDHNRSVATYAGTATELIPAMTALVGRAADHLDITAHEGVHPRNGVVDVLPFVAYGGHSADAVAAAESAASSIETLGIPTFLYGVGRTSLPELRRSLNTPHAAHERAGVVCVGAREPLVAFNVNVRASADDAKRVVAAVRRANVRALAFELASRGLWQISMNLTDPSVLGPTEAYASVAHHGLDIVDAEVVGLLPDDVTVLDDRIALRYAVRTVAEALRG